jgi:hypothetical protein
MTADRIIPPSGFLQTRAGRMDLRIRRYAADAVEICRGNYAGG